MSMTPEERLARIEARLRMIPAGYPTTHEEILQVLVPSMGDAWSLLGFLVRENEEIRAELATVRRLVATDGGRREVR